MVVQNLEMVRRIANGFRKSHPPVVLLSWHCKISRTESRISFRINYLRFSSSISIELTSIYVCKSLQCEPSVALEVGLPSHSRERGLRAERGPVAHAALPARPHAVRLAEAHEHHRAGECWAARGE